MGLRDRLGRPSPAGGGNSGSKGPTARTPMTFERTDAPKPESAYQQIKRASHQRLIEQLDSSRVSPVDSTATRQQIRELLEHLIEQDNPPLNELERHQLIEDLEYETFGLGPLEPLLRDPTVNDIMVNGYNEVYVERAGRLERTEAKFRDDRHLLQVIERIVTRAGRRIDESSPMVDARLPDGSRVNAVIAPLVVDGPALSIRRI